MGLPKNSKGIGIIVGIVAAVILLPTASEARTASTGAATTTKTYVRTFAGTNFRSLDVEIFPQLYPNSGGGVYPVQIQSQGIDNCCNYFGAGVELPNGARVTEVDFYERNCTGGPNTAYFGAYSPASGGALQMVILDVPSTSSCATRTFTRVGNPITTVTTATKRYVFDASVGNAYGGRGDATWALIGARIKYTCTSACA